MQTKLHKLLVLLSLLSFKAFGYPVYLGEYFHPETQKSVLLVGDIHNKQIETSDSIGKDLTEGLADLFSDFINKAYRNNEKPLFLVEQSEGRMLRETYTKEDVSMAYYTSILSNVSDINFAFGDEIRTSTKLMLDLSLKTVNFLDNSFINNKLLQETLDLIYLNRAEIYKHFHSRLSAYASYLSQVETKSKNESMRDFLKAGEEVLKWLTLFDDPVKNLADISKSFTEFCQFIHLSPNMEAFLGTYLNPNKYIVAYFGTAHLTSKQKWTLSGQFSLEALLIKAGYQKVFTIKNTKKLHSVITKDPMTLLTMQLKNLSLDDPEESPTSPTRGGFIKSYYHFDLPVLIKAFSHSSYMDKKDYSSDIVFYLKTQQIILNLAKQAVGSVSFDFNQINLTEYQNGVCSALSFNFLKLLNQFIIKGLPVEDALLKATDALKDIDHSSIIQEQTAFNTIFVNEKKLINSDVETINIDIVHRDKISSMLKYFALYLSGNAQSLKFESEAEWKFGLKNNLDRLKSGVYVLRGIKPATNSKMETHGHSVILVRDKDTDYLFDPNFGLLKVGSLYLNRLIDQNFDHYKAPWAGLSEYRFYKVIDIDS